MLAILSQSVYIWLREILYESDYMPLSYASVSKAYHSDSPRHTNT